MDCPASPEPLPVTMQAARLRVGQGVVEYPDGRMECVLLPPGWYYTDAGRARIAAAVDVWQTRLESVERQLSTLKAPPAREQTPTPRAPDAWALLSALALGFLLGFALGRRRARR